MLLNAFNRNDLQQIEIGKKVEEITISKTYITSTNDLLAVVQKSNMNLVYLIDLNTKNRTFFNGKYHNTGPTFKLKLILQYSQEQVSGEILTEFFARG